MTKEESKRIDFIFTMAVIAANRDADKTDLLNAVCWDVNLVREGKQPTATKELVWNTYQLDITTTPANGSPLIGNSIMIGR